jgi:YVTN family beta-propeller protein
MPHGVAVNSAAKRVYVANHSDDTLSVINSETYELVATCLVVLAGGAFFLWLFVRFVLPESLSDLMIHGLIISRVSLRF